ncbi:MAG: alpha/beta hydrolase, partial [Candidatus Nanopelagicales bacterium]|nr:alpha/beta hydrolase [Candidatus Nanopelagicales bacterium]
MKLSEVSKSLKFAWDLRGAEPLPVGDWEGRRAHADRVSAMIAERTMLPESITMTDITVTGRHGQRIPARVVRKAGSTSRGLMVFAHGGGLITGSIDASRATVARYVDQTGIPALAVGYRLAPEHPYPAAQDDVIEAIAWAYSHAGELNIDRAHIGLVGESSGGGIVAGVALRLRDAGEHPIACQLLVYPMLDDRTSSAGVITSRFLTWTLDDNATAWNCYLEGLAGAPEVSAYAAPARATELADLPPTYIEVGTLDLFREEDEDFAKHLRAAGVEVEFHLRHGAPHGFELVTPELVAR